MKNYSEILCHHELCKQVSLIGCQFNIRISPAPCVSAKRGKACGVSRLRARCVFEGCVVISVQLCVNCM